MDKALRAGWGVALASAALCFSGSALAAERLTPAIANPCTAGDALLAKHRLDDAELFYLAQLKAYPRLACARLGRATVAGERAIAERERLNGANAVRDAKGHMSVVAAAAKDVNAIEDATRKKELEEQAEQAQARASASYARARAAYEKAVAHNAQSAAQGELQTLLDEAPKKTSWDERLGERVAPFWDAVERVGKRTKTIVLDRADDAGRILAVIAAGLLFLALGVSLLLRLLLEFKPLRRRLYGQPIVGRLASRPLVVGEIKGADVDLTWQLRDALGTASAPLGQGVDLATGSDNADQVLDEVSSALDKLPQGQLLVEAWRFLRLVLLSSPLTVDGKVLAKGQRGVGVSLTIARGRHIIRTTTLWQLTYELGSLPTDDEKTPPPLDRLAIAGAAWAQYEWLGWLRGQELRKSLGTDDWQSFAFLKVGCHTMVHDASRDLAQALFAQAVDRDPENREALFNLAVIDRRRDEPGQAIERLSRLAEALAPEQTTATVARTQARDRDSLGREAFDRELLWYQATYNLAAAHVQRYLERYKPRDWPYNDRDFIQAMRYARLVVRDIEFALRWHGLWGPVMSAAQKRRQPELVAVEGPAIALLAGLLAMGRSGQEITGRPAAKACSRSAIITGAETAGYSPDLLVEGFLMKDPRRASYRARYNLACYYSRLAAMKGAGGDQERLFTRALEELALAVETGDLTVFAETDSGLEQLRKAKPAPFRRVLGGVPPSHRLAEIGVVGPVFAAKLIAVGVNSPALLAECARNEGDAQDLATAIKTSVALVRRWGKLAHLISSVDGVGSAEANLLDLARVDSLEALANSDAAILTPVLAAVNEASSTLRASPSVKMVQHWIDGANAELQQAAALAS